MSHNLAVCSHFFAPQCLARTKWMSLCREFVQSFLPHFAEDNKQIEVKADLKPGRHPCLRGDYRKPLSSTQFDSVSDLQLLDRHLCKTCAGKVWLTRLECVQAMAAHDKSASRMNLRKSYCDKQCCCAVQLEGKQVS